MDVIAHNGEQRDALEVSVEWMASLYDSFMAAVIGLTGHAEAGLQVPAVEAIFEMMGLEVSHKLKAKCDVEFRARWIEEVGWCLFLFFSFFFARFVHGQSPQRSIAHKLMECLQQRFQPLLVCYPLVWPRKILSGNHSYCLDVYSTVG